MNDGRTGATSGNTTWAPGRKGGRIEGNTGEGSRWIGRWEGRAVFFFLSCFILKNEWSQAARSSLS